MSKKKKIIYQLFPRLFTNSCETCIPNGTIEENGVGKMNDIDKVVLNSIKKLGVTHIWYTGVIEHATKTDYSKYGIRCDNRYVVKGNAGSPYAIKDYYDIDPDIAVDVKNRMAEFENLIARTHEVGMGVIIDFVPNHVARQYHSDAKPNGVEDLGANDNTDYFFAPNNNFYYIPRQLFSPHVDLGAGSNAYYEFPAKVTGNDCFTAYPTQNDWYETVKLNYGVDYGNNSRHFSPIPSTWFKMVNILRFWAAKGVDGFRCDMAHMVPVEFWNWAIPIVKDNYPNVMFIAEIYDVNLYRNYIYNGHFDYLYDKVNLYDSLRAIQTSGQSAATLTNCWQTVDGVADNMLNFLENHDEQRFASAEYAGDSRYTLPSLVVSATINRGPFLVYQGQELGERAEDAEGFSGRDGRTTIFDYWSIPTVRRWFNNGKCDTKLLTTKEIELRNTYSQILNLCNSEKAIAEGGFFDLMYVNYPNLDPHRHYVYLRHFKDEIIFIAVNFGDRQARLNIYIPPHAFNMLGIVDGTMFTATNLLSKEKYDVTLSEDTPLSSHIEPFNVVILKLEKKKKKLSKKD